ncbi:hypothetical protein CPB97_007749 [Podila verticillata]|nr:hypothetical protein CPB97_007749 [Podila verticillata]
MPTSSHKIGSNRVLVLSDALKTISTLTTLNLKSNNIGDNEVQVPTTLNLRSNEIGSDGAQALAEAPKINSTLTILGLWNNKIGDNGAQLLHRTIL